jgi:hypothetical protein
MVRKPERWKHAAEWRVEFNRYVESFLSTKKAVALGITDRTKLLSIVFEIIKERYAKVDSEKKKEAPCNTKKTNIHFRQADVEPGKYEEMKDFVESILAKELGLTSTSELFIPIIRRLMSEVQEDRYDKVAHVIDIGISDIEHHLEKRQAET